MRIALELAGGFKVVAEAASGTEVPLRAHFLRALMAELERTVLAMEMHSGS